MEAGLQFWLSSLLGALLQRNLPSHPELPFAERAMSSQWPWGWQSAWVVRWDPGLLSAAPPSLPASSLFLSLYFFFLFSLLAKVIGMATFWALRCYFRIKWRIEIHTLVANFVGHWRMGKLAQIYPWNVCDHFFDKWKPCPNHTVVNSFLRALPLALT